MASQARTGWFTRRKFAGPKPTTEAPATVAGAIDIAQDDPIIPFFLSAPSAIEIEKLHLDSPAVRSLKAAGVKLVVPLVSQGELVGILNLGARRSEQDYSTDDRRLLGDLATQAAPALRVAQLVREQKAQARERERVEQELRIARLIQQTLLPRELPSLDGWHIDTYYQPARAVGGDFYDFLPFDDGRLGIVIGDVTDKGVPAALVMATTRSILRSAAHSDLSPGAVLERTNELLHPDIPPKMFVTCLYAILDPYTGKLIYANAGHDLPYQRHENLASELRATGMPLGLMPGMKYEEKETVLAPGDSILFYSDGLVEAHNPKGDMFSFGHLAQLVGFHRDDTPLIGFLLHELAAFTGEGWEQEDDVTLVTFQRAEPESRAQPERLASKVVVGLNGHTDWQVLDAWQVPSEPGNERHAIARLEDALRSKPLSELELENLKTAVAEATMNAMEHGNQYDPAKPVRIQLLTAPGLVRVLITDEGSALDLPEPVAPDLEAKLAGLQSPRGWGLFLIRHLVDEMRVTGDETSHTVELTISVEGDSHAK